MPEAEKQKLREFRQVSSAVDAACRILNLAVLEELPHKPLIKWTHRQRKQSTVSAFEAGTTNRSHFSVPPMWELALREEQATIHVGVNVSRSNIGDTANTPVLSTALVQIDAVPNESRGTECFNSAQAMISVKDGVAKVDEVRIGIISSQVQGFIVFRPESDSPRRICFETMEGKEERLETNSLLSGKLREDITRLTAGTSDQLASQLAHSAIRAVCRGDMQLRDTGSSQSQLVLVEKISPRVDLIHRTIEESIAAQVAAEREETLWALMRTNFALGPLGWKEFKGFSEHELRAFISDIPGNRALAEKKIAHYEEDKLKRDELIGVPAEIFKFAGSKHAFRRLCNYLSECIEEMGIQEWVTAATKWESIQMEYVHAEGITIRNGIRTHVKKDGKTFILGGNVWPEGRGTQSLAFGAHNQKWSPQSINEAIWMNDVDEKGNNTTAVILRHEGENGETEVECQLILSEGTCYVMFFKRIEILKDGRKTGVYELTRCEAEEIEPKLRSVITEYINKMATIHPEDYEAIAERVRSIAHINERQIAGLLPAQLTHEMLVRMRAIAKEQGRNLESMSGPEALSLKKQVELETVQLTRLAREHIVAQLEAPFQEAVDASYVEKQFRTVSVELVREMLGIDKV